MKLAFAKLLSTILHPLILPVIAVFLVTQKEVGNVTLALYWSFLVVLFALVTAGFLLYGIKKGFISNFDVSVRKQRVIIYPFVTTMAMIFIGILYFLKGPQILQFGSIALVISLIILDFVNTKIKASIHVASVASLALSLSVIYGTWFYLFLLIVPLIAWSRVVMKRHTPRETVVGAICGFVLTLITIFIVQLVKSYGY